MLVNIRLLCDDFDALTSKRANSTCSLVYIHTAKWQNLYYAFTTIVIKIIRVHGFTSQYKSKVWTRQYLFYFSTMVSIFNMLLSSSSSVRASLFTKLSLFQIKSESPIPVSIGEHFKDKAPLSPIPHPSPLNHSINNNPPPLPHQPLPNHE